jgi:hypothetical protein
VAALAERHGMTFQETYARIAGQLPAAEDFSTDTDGA